MPAAMFVACLRSPELNTFEVNESTRACVCLFKRVSVSMRTRCLYSHVCIPYFVFASVCMPVCQLTF